MTYAFIVNDMTCSGCAASVRKAIERVPGVQGIEIDLPNQRLAIAATNNVSAEAIVAAISAAGYEEITSLGAASAG